MQSENKTALITGGTGALGSVVVQKFLEENFNVAATYRNEKELEKFSDGMRNKILFVKFCLFVFLALKIYNNSRAFKLSHNTTHQ